MDIIIDGNIQPSDGFMIGATTSQILDLTLLNKGDMVYGTSTIKVEIGLKIGNTIEYIPMGIYNIDDIEKTDYTIKITAFDNMMKFERNFTTTLGDTLTLQQVASELTRITGVQFTGNLPAYPVKKLEGFSCREILGYVASLCGGNAIITRDGKFTIVIPKDNSYSIGTSNYFEYKREETKYKIGKISCQAGEEVLSKGSLGADSMELEFENPWVTNSILQDIYNKLNGFEYLGYSMKWQGDPSIDVGDIVTITDKKGVVRKHPILSQKFTYTGGLTSEISAKGENKNKNEFSGSGPSAKKVERVVMELALINKALIDVAYIGDLTAGNIKFDTASGTIMDLQTLLAKFVTGENGQYLNLTSSNVVIANAVIKDVIAKSISAEDLKASTISTNKFKIASDNGGIEIVGATQQFKDKNNKVRIQMGQDTQGNFNFILRGEDGATTLIDHTGIKEKAIADDLIKEKMIAENAVGEKQINYSSLVTGLNKDANTSLIQASKVAIDLTGQKLDVAFNSLKSTVNDTKSKTESNTTSIGVINGQIDTLIKDTIIEENGTTVKLKDSYSTLKQTINGINATVASHTSSITNLGTNLTNAQNTANSANSLADSKAKVFTSTPTTPYKIGDIWTGGPSGEIMKCKVARASGAYVASDWEKASKYTDDTKANAVEGNLNTLSGKVTTVESNYASLSQNLEGFKTNVASTYSTKIELSSVDGKVTALTSRVSTAESSITQLNNSIDLSVSSLKKIVQEGNNNLVANSNWFKGPSGWRLSTTLAGNYFYGVSGSMALEDKHYIRLGHSNNNPTSSIYADSSKFPVSPGEKITYGAFGAATSNVRFRIYLLFTSNIDDINIDNSFMPGYTSILYEGNASYTKKNLTVIVPDGAIRAFIRVRIDKIDTSINTDSSGVFSSLMVRKGEEVFEWCPSQGDSYTYIDEQTAKLQVNINDITSRVSSTESTISTINGNVSSLQTRMSSAEQKITTNSIIQTVQSTINNAMNSAINSANSSTDSKLQNYATKASMELTSTQLRLEFKSSGGGNLLKNGRPIRGKRGLANWYCSNSAGSTAVINLGDGGENLNGEVFGSGIWWNGTRESAGGNTWCCLFNNSLESYKFNKGKTYYVSLIIYSSTSGKNININILDNNGLNHVGGYNITLNAGYQLVQFNFSPAQAGNKPNLGLYLNTPGSYNFYIPWAVVGEGYPVNNWIPNYNEIEDGNTTIDATGVKIYNGALTVLNNDGQIMLQGDGNGNLSFSGRLQPYDYQIRLFGNDCRIDGSAGAIRMQWNPQNYISVENGATRIYDNNSAGGTRYISFATDTEGHANIWGIQTRMKLLGNSSARPVIQSRNISDNAYGDFHGADFLNRSTIKDKTNVQEINDIDFKKLLMENTIKKYNLKTDVETVLDGFGLENTIDEVVASSADIRLGFILEELTQDARAMLSPGNMESISIYSMCSILWKVCQEQQKRIEALENLQ